MSFQFNALSLTTFLLDITQEKEAFAVSDMKEKNFIIFSIVKKSCSDFFVDILALYVLVWGGGG